MSFHVLLLWNICGTSRDFMKMSHARTTVDFKISRNSHSHQLIWCVKFEHFLFYYFNVTHTLAHSIWHVPLHTNWANFARKHEKVHGAARCWEIYENIRWTNLHLMRWLIWWYKNRYWRSARVQTVNLYSSPQSHQIQLNGFPHNFWFSVDVRQDKKNSIILGISNCLIKSVLVGGLFWNLWLWGRTLFIDVIELSIRAAGTPKT